MNELSVYADSTAEVVEQLQAAQRALAVAQAEKVRLETMLYRRRRCQELDRRVDPAFAGQSTATEIGVALKISQRQADREIDLGLALEHRLPCTRRAFGAGRIDMVKAQVICTELANIDDEVVAELESRIAEYAERVDPSRLKRTIRRWVLEADPAGQAKRRKQAERDRYVHVAACDNGTAMVEAVLPAAGGQTVYARVREMANTQCCSADPRTANQRRADALVALADGSGRLMCACGRRDCPRAETSTHEPRKPLVQVGVSAETLAGWQDNPGLLAGFGAIDAELARQLARHARVEVFSESETDSPTRSSESDSAARRYRPSARVAARVRAVDAVCRAPGCETPAAATDVDHVVPFDHADPARGGQTTEANLGCLCRRHHRLKTVADNGANSWRVRRHPGRRDEWVTPTGASATTEPEGASYLFPEHAVAATQRPVRPSPVYPDQPPPF